MIQAALVYVARHANATMATATATLVGGEMRIVAADDGRRLHSGVSLTVVDIRIPIEPEGA